MQCERPTRFILSRRGRRPDRLRTRCGLLSLLLLAALVLAGCAATPATTTENADTSASAGRSQWARLMNPENGLEVRQWVIADNSTRIAEAMHAFDEEHEAAFGEEIVKRLRRNGFRIARVPIDELDSLAEAFGGRTLNVESWFGQVNEWRELHKRALSRERRAISVDGRARTFSPGELKLLLRSWIMPMEDGPTVMVQLLPHHRAPRPVSYRELLGGRRRGGESLATLAMELQLEPGYAVVLIAAAPDEQWNDSGEENAQGDENDGSSGSSRRAARTGPGMGPPVATPVTVGELLLLSDGRGVPSRGVLVFVPRIGSELLPPAELESSDVRRTMPEQEKDAEL
ncbi:MAG: hypothetical protein EA377_06255 [Phycisphaerales bacterium]|nr:MAG: hypothetical protein EA377_06255 [Phycisphaerales bacterium]